jgi:DNA-binding NarL/FixJ family response regulator
MILALVVVSVRAYRDAIARAFDGHRELQVVGVAGPGAGALRLVDELAPDVALVDVSTAAGIAAARAIAVTTTRPVALAAPEEDALVVACVQAGVRAFVAREGTLSDVVDAARSALRGDAVGSPQVVAALMRTVASTPGTPPSTAPLTARERQIVGLIDEGLSNKEIAARLCIELSTVKNHVHNALEKLGARGRSEAAARLRMVAG